jgi:quercetin dioxygenase-like cupin family protein
MVRLRLFLGLGLVSALGVCAGLAIAQTRATATAAHKMLSPDMLAWGAPPPGLPPALQAAVLDGNPMEAGFYVVRLRLPDGTAIKPHWHSKDEHITVISGKFSMGFGDQLTTTNLQDGMPGAYFSMPAGQRHFATAHGETVVQVDGVGPFDIKYVNPTDDPRQKRSAR